MSSSNPKLEKVVTPGGSSTNMGAIIESQARVFAAAYAAHIAAEHGSTTAADRACNAMRAFYNNVQVPELD